MIPKAPPGEYRLSSYDYPLDESLIAQVPSADRDQARLMVLDRKTGRIEHRRFQDLVHYLRPSDVLVVNDTRVIPARLPGRKMPGGGKIEVLMLREADGPKQWEVLLRGSVHAGQAIRFGTGETAVVRRDLGYGRKILEWMGEEAVASIIARLGHTPLPPYIRRSPAAEDREQYQTVYAAAPGSVAAPTAGLHFTETLLDRIRAHGVNVVSVTLHIGPGTFRPVRCGDIRRHQMDSEWYDIGPSAVEVLEEVRRRKGRIVAVGTTATRVLESAIRDSGSFQARSGWTALFITPGYSFKCVDGLVTNFHLPKSTLLMLVSAFAGLPYIRQAYAEALRSRYRFLSYGDAMLILS
ncbi:MAG TPA: tRNA preQ1(34) S-adenosylmethionine ribosyltransferase-isomerase QueA [Nitrospiria bacterium]|jgi:S-adenosylmethionine:tRNA ribosyltransferase-isomerase|nr:tRNA preQ1(34) S-adenosylmethionine ribosyltransferase-isomerase QueA [Nitrospiria bacterium]